MTAVHSSRPDPLRSWTDPELLAGIRDQSGAAFEEVHRRYAFTIFQVAYRVTGQHLVAEDVAQEVMLRLWSTPQRVDASRGTLRGYLLLEARARAVDVLRRETARRRREERDARHMLNADRLRDDPTDGWTLDEQTRAALDVLHEDQRVAITLAYFGDHTYRDVSALLGVPEGTVKNRIRSGLRRLRVELGFQLLDDGA